MDCRPWGSSVQENFQATVLEWVAISYSRGSSQPRDWTHSSCISCMGGRAFAIRATWEAHNKTQTVVMAITISIGSSQVCGSSWFGLGLVCLHWTGSCFCLSSGKPDAWFLIHLWGLRAGPSHGDGRSTRWSKMARLCLVCCCPIGQGQKATPKGGNFTLPTEQEETAELHVEGHGRMEGKELDH